MAQLHRIGKTATRIRHDDGTTSVYYHDTPVVKFTNKNITLRSGGWYTKTTKTRMNQVSNQYGLGYYVRQKDYEWLVGYRGKERKFREGMKLRRML
jgi:hypothetical protein